MEDLFGDTANEVYNSTTIGKAMAKADRLISEMMYDEQMQWQIVPADFYRPYIVDQYMHRLVDVFEKESVVKAKCADPNVVKDEIIGLEAACLKI